MSYYIYKLEIGDYFYYGSSKMKGNTRLIRHKSNSYCIKSKEYNTKKSRKK